MIFFIYWVFDFDQLFGGCVGFLLIINMFGEMGVSGFL